MLLCKLFQFKLFKFIEVDLHLFFHNYHIFDLRLIYKTVYFLFELFLECFLSFTSILYFLQPIQIYKLLFPDSFMALLKNDVFMIGMHVVDELSGCFGVDDEIVQVWIIFVQQLQHLKRGRTVLFMPVLGVVEGEGKMAVDSAGSEVPQKIGEHAIFRYYIYPWP